MAYLFNSDKSKYKLFDDNETVSYDGEYTDNIDASEQLKSDSLDGYYYEYKIPFPGRNAKTFKLRLKLKNTSESVQLYSVVYDGNSNNSTFFTEDHYFNPTEYYTDQTWSPFISESLMVGDDRIEVEVDVTVNRSASNGLSPIVVKVKYCPDGTHMGIQMSERLSLNDSTVTGSFDRLVRKSELSSIKTFVRESDIVTQTGVSSVMFTTTPPPSQPGQILLQSYNAMTGTYTAPEDGYFMWDFDDYDSNSNTVGLTGRGLALCSSNGVEIIPHLSGLSHRYMDSSNSKSRWNGVIFMRKGMKIRAELTGIADPNWSSVMSSWEFKFVPFY